jgi:hypothetical protein
MKVYVVGGAVRDELLGRPVADRDYVVVGATPDAMIAQGFRPVGRDFPVFLHPETNEEYAPRAPSARGPRLSRLHLSRGAGCHAGSRFASGLTIMLWRALLMAR